MRIAVLILTTLVLSSTAHGMVYSWTDSAGVSHYTNKEYEIPARYRAKVKIRYPEQSDASVPQQSVLTAQPQTAQPAQPQVVLSEKPKNTELHPISQTPQTKPVVPNNSSSPRIAPREAQNKKPEHAGRWKPAKAKSERSTYPDE